MTDETKLRKLEEKEQVIRELLDSNEEFVSLSDVGKILNADPNTIRRQAVTEPRIMGFPVSVIGNRTHIPRIPFLRFLGREA